MSPALTGGFFTTELREAHPYTYTHSFLSSFPIELSFIFLRLLTWQYYEPRASSTLLPIHPSIHSFHQRSSGTSTSQCCGKYMGWDTQMWFPPPGAQLLMEPSDSNQITSRLHSYMWDKQLEVQPRCAARACSGAPDSVCRLSKGFLQETTFPLPAKGWADVSAEPASLGMTFIFSINRKWWKYLGPEKQRQLKRFHCSFTASQNAVTLHLGRSGYHCRCLSLRRAGGLVHGRRDGKGTVILLLTSLWVEMASLAHRLGKFMTAKGEKGS